MISNKEGGGKLYVSTTKDPSQWGIGKKDSQGNYPVMGSNLEGYVIGLEYITKEYSGQKDPGFKLTLLGMDGKTYVWTPFFTKATKGLLNQMLRPEKLGHVDLYIYDSEYIDKEGKTRKEQRISMSMNGENIGWLYPYSQKMLDNSEGKMVDEIIPAVEYHPNPVQGKPKIADSRAQDAWFYHKFPALSEKVMSREEAMVALAARPDGITKMDATYGDKRSQMGIEKQAGDDKPPLQKEPDWMSSVGDDQLPF